MLKYVTVIMFLTTKAEVYDQQKQLVKGVVFAIGLNEYFVDGKTPGTKMDAKPYMQDGRTFVPIRYLGYALGVTPENIAWDGGKKKVALRLGNNSVEMVIGKKGIFTNGLAKDIDVAPILNETDGRTYLPARYIAEGLGYEVGWDEATRTALCWPKGESKPDISKVQEYVRELYHKREIVWVPINNGYLQGKKPISCFLAIDSQSSKTIYATTSDGAIVKTTDEGASWTAIYYDLMTLGSLSFNPLAIAPKNPDVFYVGTGDKGVITTSNGGIAWSLANKGLPQLPETFMGYKVTPGMFFTVKCIAVDPRDSNVVYIGSWKKGIYKTTDGGATWTDQNKGLPGGESVTSIAIEPKDPNVIYIGTENEGVYKTANGGVSWFAVNKGLLGLRENGAIRLSLTVNSLVIDPKNPSAVYVGTDDGVYKTTNGGSFWTQVNQGLPVNPDVLSLAINPNDSNIIYAGTHKKGVYKTNNGGTSWITVNKGLPAEAVKVDIISLVIDPSDPNVVYAGTQLADIYASYKENELGIFKTTNSQIQ